jgi:hypothetical protein
MSQIREPGFDRAVALVLRIGAFAAFLVMLDRGARGGGSGRAHGHAH